MKDNRRFLLQIARGKQPKQNLMRVYTIVNGEKVLQSEQETDFDREINIEVVTNDAGLLKLQTKA